MGVMTPATLRTLMARAFAEEVEKHDHYRRGQQFITERGIAAAMRAAAEHCRDVEVPTNGTSHDPFLCLAWMTGEEVFKTLGELA